MSEADRSQLFEHFYGDRNASQIAGTGLGLDRPD
jgi:signal transduction histidine kinase